MKRFSLLFAVLTGLCGSLNAVTRYEAENATLVNVLIQNDATASGSKRAAVNWDATDPKATITFEIEAPAAGYYPITVRYAGQWSDNDRYEEIQINGVNVDGDGDDYGKSGNIWHFPSGPGQGGVWQSKVVTVDPADANYGSLEFAEGVNTVTIKHNYGGTYFDYIELPWDPPLRPSNPDPQKGATVQVLAGQIELNWTNHSEAFPETGDDVICYVYLGTEPNEALPHYGLKKIPAETAAVNNVTTYVAAGRHYYWVVEGWDGDSAFQQGPLWDFHTTSRVPEARYEAEDVSLPDGASLINNGTAVSLKSALQITFTVWPQQAGDYLLTVGGGNHKEYYLDVNGTTGPSLMLDEIIDYPVTLNAGENTISFKLHWSWGEIDYISLNFNDFRAVNLNPADGSVALDIETDLSWENRGILPGGADVSCWVYFGASDKEPTEITRDDLALIAWDLQDDHIDANIEWGENYYWIVDCNVPDGDAILPFKNEVWSFITIDPIPVVELDATATLKTTMTAALGAKVTDLGVEGLTYEWKAGSGPDAIDNVCSDRYAMDPDWTFTNAGTYVLELYVQDGGGNHPDPNPAIIAVEVVDYFNPLRLEAEEAVVSETAEIMYLADAGNKAAVAFTEYSVHWASFAFNAPASGSYEMLVGGFGLWGAAKPTKLQVNGVQKPSNDEPRNDLWNFGGPQYGVNYVRSVPVELLEGENTIQLTANYTGVAIDYIEFPMIKAANPYNPSPANRSMISVDLDLTELNWLNPEPNDPGGGVITCDVFWGDAEPNDLAEGYGLTQVADDASEPTATIPPQNRDLVDGKTYYWIVECSDASQPGVIKKAVWSYTATADMCPVFAWPGDLDFNCIVSVGDLSTLAQTWLADDEEGCTLDEFDGLSNFWLTSLDPVTGALSP